MRRARGYSVLLFVFVFMYACNALMPMLPGDDYVFSFVWDGTGGWNIHMPLPETAHRLASWSDWSASLASLYMTWSGRLVAHGLAQFFLWVGKTFFNVANSLVFVLLIVEIYWLGDAGRISSRFKASRLVWIFFAIWSFTLGFGGIVFWEVGAFHYLWTVTLLLGFLLPYVHFYLSSQEYAAFGRFPRWAAIGMFFYGLAAGCTNEHTICWLIFAGAWLAHRLWRQGQRSFWLRSGLAGFVLGYIVLMAAPGNLVRAVYDGQQIAVPLSTRLWMLGIILVFQFFLWFFLADGLYKQRQRQCFGIKADVLRQLFFLKLLMVVSFLVSLSMLLAAKYPARAAFPATIYLVAATSVMLQLQETGKCNVLPDGLRNLFHLTGSAFLLVTMAATLYGCSFLYRVEQNNVQRIAAAHQGPDRAADVLLQQYTVSPELCQVRFCLV